MPVTAYFEGARFLKVSVTALFEIAGRPAGRRCVYNFVNLVFTKREKFEKIEKKSFNQKKDGSVKKKLFPQQPIKGLTKNKSCCLRKDV